MNEALIEKVVKEFIDEMRNTESLQKVEVKESIAKDSIEIPLETSARHVHLSKEDLEFLFGDSEELGVRKKLSQPGQFQYDERVNLIGPKGNINNVAILGPARSQSQVEISYTDARTLGVQPPLKDSGDLEGSVGIIISTGKKALNLSKGVIVAKRHIHMTEEDARKLGVKNGQEVSVKIKSRRPAILEGVLIRVSDNYSFSMHIDHDEGNATAYLPGTKAEIVK
ncbi:phosphate propanoyltransferase [Proteinivorax tanatarense]|uniref:Phosphate propanoyltransferase n=1 Tax=Proteinivorax tanatarense TaxID=1260629 RepID=A0AAU7VJC5_9FIRM